MLYSVRSIYNIQFYFHRPLIKNSNWKTLKTVYYSIINFKSIKTDKSCIRPVSDSNIRNETK